MYGRTSLYREHLLSVTFFVSSTISAYTIREIISVCRYIDGTTSLCDFCCHILISSCTARLVVFTCMCVYIYVHVCTYMYIYICIKVSTYTYTYIYMYILYIYIYIYVCKHICTNVCKYIYIYTYVYV